MSTTLIAIPGFSAYRAGSDGFIYTAKRRGNKRPSPNEPLWVPLARHKNKRQNRWQVTLFDDAGKQKTKRVATLIALAFHGRPVAGQEVCHKAGGPLNDRPENLSWGSHQENVKDAVARREMPHGSKHWRARLTEDSVIEIIRLCRNGTSQVAAGKRFGVSGATVGFIMSGKIWKHVTR